MLSDEEEQEQARDIAEALLDVERWDGNIGYLRECPGENEHTTPSDGSPLVYLDSGTVSCFHQSCEATRRDLSAQLRQALGDRLGIRHKPTPEEREQAAFRRYLRQLKAGARNRLLPKLLKEPPISLSDWEHSSPLAVRDVPVRDQWRLLLGGLYARSCADLNAERYPNTQFPERSLPLLWIGELNDTGPDAFATCSDWLKRRHCPGPQICPAEFAGPYIGRTKEAVDRREYLVIESDDLPLEQFGSVVVYVAERMHLTLRAVVFTGNKSIHAWFSYNYLCFLATHLGSENYRAHAQTCAILKGLRCDSGLFGLASTTRLPGVERLDDDGRPTGKRQRLVYLNPKFPITL